MAEDDALYKDKDKKIVTPLGHAAFICTAKLLFS